MFVFLIGGLLTGHPLAFVLGGIGSVIGIIGWGPSIFDIIVTRMYDTMTNYGLVAIPLFVLMANFLMYSEIADGLFESVRYLFGGVRGGLAVAVILVSTVFAATTGIVGASVISMGLLGIPVLLRYGYDKQLTVGVVCAGGSLGILIPPSIMLVIMATYAQLSVGQLFLAAIPPGLLLSLAYTIYILVMCHLHPEWGPAMSKEEIAAVPKSVVIQKTLVNLVPPMLLILGVLGSIFMGVTTPTEASGVGAFLAFLLTLLYRKFNLEMLHKCVTETAKTTAMCFVILYGANAFTSVFMGLGGDTMVVKLVKALGLGKWGAFFLMLAIVFVLGCFIDWIGIVMIVFPIFLPLLSSYGFSKLYIAGISAVLLQTCFLTPPFGYALFYAKSIVPPHVTIKDIYKGIIPFVLIICGVTALCVIFPKIITGWAMMAKM